MRLSVLMLALTNRREMRRDVELSLLRQCRDGCAEFRMVETDGSVPSGALRGPLTMQARGDYVAWVDDDDLVADDYVARIIAGTAANPDVVTFDVVRSDNGQRWVLGLNHRDWSKVGSHVVKMRANHLCAWRREIAQAVPWSPIGYADDVAWYMVLAASGLAQTEHHVDAPLYTYRFSRQTTANQTRGRIRQTREHCAGGLDAFRYESRIVVAARGRRYFSGSNRVEVREADGRCYLVDRDKLELLTTVRI